MAEAGEETEETLTVATLTGVGPDDQLTAIVDDDVVGPGTSASDEVELVERDGDYVDMTRLIAWGRRQDPVRCALWAMCVGWALLFFVLGAIRHDRFATFGFDLGIYDQAIWLMSQFKEPFITIRGLNFFGHHLNPILILLAPFYWLGAGPIFLLFVQVSAQASGAVAIYLLARDRFRATAAVGTEGGTQAPTDDVQNAVRWPAVAMAGILLLNPTYQYLVWEYFHPDALAIAPLLFAYWAARARRWRWFAVAAVLAMACKEDVAMPMIVLGVLIAVRGDRRIGYLVSALAALWFAFATRIVIPWANGIGPFYDSFFDEFGSSTGEVAMRVVSRPGKTLEVVTRPDRIDYFRMMFAPFAFIPFLAAPTLMLAAPTLGVNALSSFPYAREIRYHYAALVLTGLMVATVEAIAHHGRTPSRRAFLVGLVMATTLASTVAWGPSPVSTKYRSGLWPLTVDSRQAAKDAAVAAIPPRAAASVHYQFAPHMTHRSKIYEWPVPWEPTNWGVRGENLHDPREVEWLLLDRQLLNGENTMLLDRLLSEEEFTIRSEKDGIVVAQRINGGVPSP